MIVHQLTTFPFGGAGGAAVRHHQAVRGAGLHSRLFVRRNDSGRAPASPTAIPELYTCEWVDSPTAGQSSFWQRWSDRRRRRRICEDYQRHLAPRSQLAETFADSELVEPTQPNAHLLSANILHLHWISFLIDYPSFFANVPRHLPLLWTLHDMNPLTGGCHYAGDCLRFRTGCGSCPQVAQPESYDISRRVLLSKAAALEGHTVTVVSPSRWLDRLAKQSPIWPDTTNFHVIPYGLDLQQFQPVSREAARARWRLPPQSHLVGFVADNLNNPRKGYAVLAKALAALPAMLGASSPVELVVLGRGGDALVDCAIPVHRLGYLESPRELSAAYSALDVLALPSLEDNLPQTGLEAMACGKPVVGFEIGGIPDFVFPGKTGGLARPGDPIALAHEIALVLGDHRLQQRYAAGARRLVAHEFEQQQKTQKYLDLYREIARPQRPRLQRAA